MTNRVSFSRFESLPESAQRSIKGNLDSGKEQAVTVKRYKEEEEKESAILGDGLEI